MSALTETSSNVTEFAGKFKVAMVEVDGTTATNDTVTIDEMDTVVGAVATLKEDSTAACCGVTCKVDGTTTNQITCRLIEGDGTVCTQTPLDFYLFAVGY